MEELEGFAGMLPPDEQAAFRKLMATVRERRGAIDKIDDDLNFAILLAIASHLESELDAVRRQDSPKGPQARLEAD